MREATQDIRPDAPPEEVVLASASPRRQELLRAAGIRFDVAPSHVPEEMRDGEPAGQFAVRMAVEKAEAAAASLPAERRPVVAADTIVVVSAGAPDHRQHERVLGKPASHEEAAAMLRLLSARTHVVLTGVCVLDPASGRRLTRVVRTEVTFSEMSEEEIRDYVATGEPMDKAGAYAIQGRASRFVERIDGCYFNVVGLPVPALYGMLKELRGTS